MAAPCIPASILAPGPGQAVGDALLRGHARYGLSALIAALRVAGLILEFGCRGSRRSAAAGARSLEVIAFLLGMLATEPLAQLMSGTGPAGQAAVLGKLPLDLKRVAVIELGSRQGP